MTDDDHLLRAIRDAAGPRLAPGAAERIASGAWERAAKSPAGDATRRRVLPRLGWTAAAAAVLVAAVLLLRGAEAAFAVEGDPVMVQRGDAWVSTREVPADVLVHAPAGSRVLRSRAGDVLRPRPGSVFRVVLERTSSRPVYRAEFAEGGGDVDGAGVVVVIGDDVVVERDPAAPKLRLSFAMSDGAPRFAVGEGRAVARAVVSGERLALAAAERGAYLSISDKGGVARRFAKVESWSDDAASRIAEGGLRFVDADFRGAGGITLVGGSPSGGFLAYEVPPVAVGQALRCVNGGAARRMLVNVRASPAASPARYVYENGATRVEVEVDACGAVRVCDASGRRAFVNLAAFRREAPATAALFGDTLGR